MIYLFKYENIMRRIKILIILSFFIGMIFLAYAGPKIYRQYRLNSYLNKREVNFPQAIEAIDKMPNADSVYIFLMAGQSNMAGRGLVEPKDTIPNKRILTINKSMVWIYAKEPIHFYEPNKAGLDCGMSFANKLLDTLPEGITVALVPCAVGNTSIEQWLNNATIKGVPLLDNFRSKVKFAKDYGQIKGILWHQGERNTHSELIPTYSQKLDSLMNIFKNVIENDTLPIIFGELGKFPRPKDERARWDSINNIIHNLAERKNYAVVSSVGLKHIGDRVHFNSEAQRELGARYAQKYLELTK